MYKYINGGVIKSITLFYKNEETTLDLFNVIGDLIDLELFDMNRVENCIHLDIKKDILNNNFVDLLKELKFKDLALFDSIDYNIKYLSENKGKDIDTLIKDCDDIFLETFRFDDITIFDSDMYNIEIEYYAVYYDGPYNDGRFNNIIYLMYRLLRNNLDNVLKDALCFGIGS